MAKSIKVKWICVFSILDIVGIALLICGKSLGIFPLSAGIMLQLGYIVGIMLQNRKYKVCVRCQSMIRKGSRICPVCGFVNKELDEEKELADAIDRMSSEQIDCDFDKIEEIEEIAVDELAVYDGDIEAFLKSKEEGECWETENTSKKQEFK